ncbi:DNA topoisomerase IB [Kaistia terrae]|uniref:DNA topoisomerase IB n=1 Tax=Kaistia terrae TaxID=537017 RepID=A0ABW0Q2K8_9HYPH|nr:DNA topoisomerase IB [Kaistia terrae]MCX5580498.1 DNA topoisomerase IB [Kaistia terrae]
MSDLSKPPSESSAIRAGGLVMVSGEDLDIRRRRCGTGFIYLDPRGVRIREASVIARIASLSIPPAYTDVRIATRKNAHLQAIGRDAAGRWQHRYHDGWQEVRENRKVERLTLLVAALPKLRAQVRRDIARRQLDCTKALACAVAIIDQSHIRVGSEVYAATSGARGAATLLKRQTRLSSSRLLLCFKGKGGTTINCELRDAALVRALRRIHSLAGPRLIQFRDSAGQVRPIHSQEINDYLRSISGADISAKDLRMLGANALAAEHLARLTPASSESALRRQLNSAMRLVADNLGNTPAVVRKSYVHVSVVEAFASGKLAEVLVRVRGGRARNRAENLLRALIGGRESG